MIMLAAAVAIAATTMVASSKVGRTLPGVRDIEFGQRRPGWAKAPLASTRPVAANAPLVRMCRRMEIAVHRSSRSPFRFWPLAAMAIPDLSSYQRLRGREGIGLGDAKLAGAAGVWLDWPSISRHWRRWRSAW
jgi:hypothetical protein